MKSYLLICLSLCAFSLQAQFEKVNWIQTKIYLKNGEEITTKSIINDRFFEGTLITKTDDKILTFSPHSIQKFTFYPTNSAPIQIESIPTTFIKSRGEKDSFLIQYHLGSPYSIYKKWIPRKKKSGSMWVNGIEIETIQDEIALFIKNADKAYQISLPRGTNYDRRKFNVQKAPFFEVFEDKREIKDFISRKRLNIKKIDDLIKITEYANRLHMDQSSSKN